ncbi:MAG: hypothetical protein IPH44_12610 [Myxococcales bacterium]|nr:hypothetical protein [Myxococcales bacterium]MBK7194106.1 hypothetical protein [Myxococcales bacterium]
MLAEKCPNCGAFLPVRRAGVTIRACEFCELEVPGGVVEVEALAGPSSTWLPPHPPVRRVERPAAPSAGRLAIALVISVVAVLGVVAFVITSVRTGAPASRPVAAPPPAVAVTAPPPEPRAPPDPPERAALRAAIAAAGDVAALDPLALLPYVDQRARAAAPDARLLSVQCTSVGAAGTADLTLASGRCSYAYRTPAGTERPPDVPVGVSTDYPCAVELAVDAGVTQPDVRVARRSLDLCRIHHAVRPPACTFAAAWERALAAGAPRDAVARVRFAGRYQSGYDPVDPADDFDVPERGRWSVEIARDGQDDLRYEFRDDCGAPPPSADAQALRAEVTKARPALARCLTKAVGGARGVEALGMRWRLDVDRRGATRVAFFDADVDLEGAFEGDLDGIRARWADCANALPPRWRVAPALAGVVVDLRVEPAGALAIDLEPPAAVVAVEAAPAGAPAR